MSHFRPFELEALKLLAQPHFESSFVDALAHDSELVSFEDNTWCGYYLTVRHPSLPVPRIVLDKPKVVGRAGDFEVGFVIFVEDGELTLECYTRADASDVPDNFRNLEFQVSAT